MLSVGGVLAQSLQQASVPFWLQVTAVALAPIIGFAGVAIGALLKNRSDIRLALYSERRKVYIEFSKSVHEYAFQLTNDAALALARPAESNTHRRFMKRVRACMRQIDLMRLEVSLISPNSTLEAFDAVLVKILEIEVKITACRLQNKVQAPDHSAWLKLALDVIGELQNFQQQVAGEIGLARRRRSEREQVESAEWRNEVLQTFSDIVESFRKKSSISDK